MLFNGNGNINITLLVEGNKSLSNALSFSGPVGDNNLSSVPLRVSEHHQVDIIPIQHSLSAAKKVILNGHGRAIDFIGCAGDSP